MTEPKDGGCIAGAALTAVLLNAAGAGFPAFRFKSEARREPPSADTEVIPGRILEKACPRYPSQLRSLFRATSSKTCVVFSIDGVELRPTFFSCSSFSFFRLQASSR